MGDMEASALLFPWMRMPVVDGSSPFGAICGSYLRRLTLAWLVYFTDAAQLIGALAVVRPWLGKADGGNTATPLHLRAPPCSATAPCSSRPSCGSVCSSWSKC